MTSISYGGDPLGCFLASGSPWVALTLSQGGQNPNPADIGFSGPTLADDGSGLTSVSSSDI